MIPAILMTWLVGSAIGLVGFLIIWIGYLMGCAASIHQLFSSHKVK